MVGARCTVVAHCTFSIGEFEEPLIIRFIFTRDNINLLLKSSWASLETISHLDSIATNIPPEHIHDRHLSHSIKETLNTKGQVDHSLNCSSLHATLILHSEYSGNLKLEVVGSNIHV